MKISAAKKYLSVSFLLLLAGSLFLMRSNIGRETISSRQPENKTPPTRELSHEKSQRAVAITFADQRLKKSKEFSDRIRKIRSEIDKSPNPSAVFKELADLLSSIEDPLHRSVLGSEILNAMLTFDSPKQGVEWLTAHQSSILENFANIQSGSGHSAYEDLCSIYARRAIGRGQETETFEAIRSNPTNDILPGILLPIVSEMVSYTGNFNELELFNSDPIKEASLGYILRSHNPAEKTSGIERYLKPEFSSFSDPDSKIIRKFASPAWYAANAGEIDSILSKSAPGPSKNRFLAVLAELAAKSGDGNEFTFVDQIDDAETRDRIERNISVITSGSENE